MLSLELCLELWNSPELPCPRNSLGSPPSRWSREISVFPLTFLIMDVPGTRRQAVVPAMADAERLGWKQ